jgi:16S rRNA (adenine1518-N6/adenine1519-N6)-dimethyltransferase
MHQEEQFDIVDSVDNVIGSASRSYVHANNLLHRAVHIWIFNKKGEILLQKRSMEKDRFPGRWTSSVSGHVDSGETYEHAALREIEEEIGIQIAKPLKQIGYITASERTEQEFIKLYTGVSEGPFQINEEEVSELRWVSPKQLEQWLQEDPEAFTPSLDELWILHHSNMQE